MSEEEPGAFFHLYNNTKKKKSIQINASSHFSFFFSLSNAKEEET